MKQSVVGIVRKDGRFLLGLREPGGDVGSHWEFPGGKCEAGETHEQALIREYEEELTVHVVPRQDDEFTCSQCFLVHHASQLDHVDANGNPVCTECAM